MTGGFPAGTVLTDEEETGVSFGVIAAGRAAVSVHGRPVRILGPVVNGIRKLIQFWHGTGSVSRAADTGDCFGEMALIDNSYRSATITAETELRCLLFVAWVFRPLPSRTRRRPGPCRR